MFYDINFFLNGAYLIWKVLLLPKKCYSCMNPGCTSNYGRVYLTKLTGSVLILEWSPAHVHDIRLAWVYTRHAVCISGSLFTRPRLIFSNVVSAKACIAALDCPANLTTGFQQEYMKFASYCGPISKYALICSSVISTDCILLTFIYISQWLPARLLLNISYPTTSQMMSILFMSTHALVFKSSLQNFLTQRRSLF